MASRLDVIAFKFLISARYGVAAAGLLFGAGCSAPTSYTANPIDAYVMDAETHAPIEGAIVAANWQLVRGGLDGWTAHGQLEVKETITDHVGHFHFDGFTKQSVYELRDDDPKVIVFKPGYRYRTIANIYPAAGTRVPEGPRTAAVSRQTVALFRYRGDYSENDPPYSDLGLELQYVIADCEWKSMPRLFLTADQESHRLAEEHPTVVAGLPTIERLEVRASKCGSAIEFFRGRRVDAG